VAGLSLTRFRMALNCGSVKLVMASMVKDSKVVAIKELSRSLKSSKVTEEASRTTKFSESAWVVRVSKVSLLRAEPK
jgi:hypothetical protein